MSIRADKLAERIELGANKLAEFVETLNDQQWQTIVQPDGRTVGVIVHHVAAVYPEEVKIAQIIGSGRALKGVTFDGAIREMNSKHMQEHSSVARQETLHLLQENAAAAAVAVRQFTDEELDRAEGVSLNADAPLTAQFVIEDHAVRHSFHHLARIRKALKL